MPDFIFYSRHITHSKTTPYTHSVVIHSVKLKILKANHNCGLEDALKDKLLFTA